MLGFVGYHTGTGDVQTRMAIVTCPECTYLENGTCVVCGGPDDHPSCSGCRDGAVVWYRRPMVVSVAMAVGVSLVATIIVSQVKKHVSFFSD